MEKNVLVIILSFCFSSFFAQINQTDSKGRKQGVWQKTYPNSIAFEYKGQFKDDKPVGTFTYFYPSTKVKAVVKHDANSTRSSAYLYHENTLLMAFGIYRNQLKDSVWTHFGPSGRISFKETYKNGKLNGMKVTYYVPEELSDKSQRVARTEMYVNDVKEGEVKEYFENGTLKMEGNYVKGKPNGVITTYHPNGKPMIKERYKYGNRHGWSFGYSESGAETGKRYFRFGDELTGKQLEDWMNKCKAEGKSPND